MTKTKKIHRLHFRMIEQIAAMSYTELFSLWIVVTCSFAAGYFILSSFGDIQHHGLAALATNPDPLSRLGDALYYSIITGTTTGYGDIVPSGFSKVLASIQSISAWLLFGVLVTKLVSHQQEIALREVHRLTFEDVFHNVREGLFIVRKDCDNLMAKVEGGKHLNEEDWGNLEVAYEQGKTMIAEIPDFYDSENHLYMIDEQREQLLHEGVQRTLHRINQMLDVFSEHDIPWAKHEKTLNELRSFIRMVTEVAEQWQQKSPYAKSEAFEDILLLQAAIEGRIANAVKGG